MNAKPAFGNGAQRTSGRLKKRVLIVDDDTSVRTSISSVVQAAGYEVMQAGDGQEALTRFDPKQIDMVLLDLAMPNKGGWDTFEGFTSQDPALPIIIITGQARQTEMARAAGVGALMEKPLDAELLLQTMQDLLSESEEARLRRLVGYNQDLRYIPPRPHFKRAGAAFVPANRKKKG